MYVEFTFPMQAAAQDIRHYRRLRRQKIQLTWNRDRCDVEPAPTEGLESCEALERPWEVSMPHYEFFCKACKKTFSKIMTIAEHDAEKPSCQHCGSQDVEQRWSAFSAVTSKKSA